jgi:hypothetical protein
VRLISGQLQKCLTTFDIFFGVFPTVIPPPLLRCTDSVHVLYCRYIIFGQKTNFGGFEEVADSDSDSNRLAAVRPLIPVLRYSICVYLFRALRLHGIEFLSIGKCLQRDARLSNVAVMKGAMFQAASETPLRIQTTG